MKKVLLLLAMVATLMSCSPEEQTGYEQSISSILTSETSWLSDEVGDEGGAYRWGWAFKGNDNGGLEFSSLFQQILYDECLVTTYFSGTPTIEVFIDRIMLNLEDGQRFGFTIEGNLLKMSNGSESVFFKPDSVTLLCDS